MKKEDFVVLATAAVRSDYDRALSRADMESALAAFCDVAAAELLDDGEISLPGLGKLKVKETSARTGRNPRTGERIDIPASRKVVFTPFKEFREALHG